MKRSDSVISALIFFLSLILYTHTAARGLLFGDSAELQTIGYTLGMGHPTGYSIYIAIAKVFTYLPIGEIAYRVNLLSVFFGALTVTFVHLIARTLGAGSVSSVFASLLLALTPLFWKHATIAEIYALSSTCLAIILFALLTWDRSKKGYWLFIAGLFGGISLGIHFTVTLAALPVLLYLGTSQYTTGGSLTEKLKPALFGAVSGLAIFLLSFYLLDQRNTAAGFYNAVAIPSLSIWGMAPEDFNSPIERLAFLSFPPQFKGQFLAVPFDEVILRLKEFGRTFTVLSIFGFTGVLSLFIPFSKKFLPQKEGWLFTSALLIFMTFAASYAVDDFIVFYIPSLLILAICSALGLQRIVDLGSQFKYAQSLLITSLIYMICFVAGTAALIGTLPSAWQNRMPPELTEKFLFGFQHPGAYKLNAEKIVNKIEDDAIVFTNWDRVYGLYYVSHVLQGRSGMDFHETYPQKDRYLPAVSLLAYIDENMDRRPIYFTRYPDFLDETYQVVQITDGLFQISRE
jgi:hypothetical protein